MQRIDGLIKSEANKLLAEGIVNRVLGWKKGDFFYDHTPGIFYSSESLSEFVYDGFCSSNLSKYLIKESKKDGKILIPIKPCDTYNLNQLIKEHRVDRDNIYVLGIDCRGMIDIDKIKDMGIKGIEKIDEDGNEILIHTIYGNKTINRSDLLLEKCLCCKGKEHVIYDKLLILDEVKEEEISQKYRFKQVEELEAMTAEERFEFWRSELSKCIRCNACRNVCPSCSCHNCVFDNDDSGIATKSNADTFEENMFHIIRALHVAGRCTDCGECSRVCPQHIPLHLLNRKVIKDINEFYGEYQAGLDIDEKTPLTNFSQDDPEPNVHKEEGGAN